MIYLLGIATSDEFQFKRARLQYLYPLLKDEYRQELQKYEDDNLARGKILQLISLAKDPLDILSPAWNKIMKASYIAAIISPLCMINRLTLEEF